MALPPPFRVRGKRSPKDLIARKKLKTKRRSRVSERRAAIGDGLAPKACRPFALFMKDHCNVHKGASKDAHAQEMKRLGQKWRDLPPSEKEAYRAKCAAEFEAQRVQLRVQGVKFRQHLLPECKGQRLEPFSSSQSENTIKQEQQEDVRIGAFRCHTDPKTQDGSCLYVGEGSYGAVLLSDNHQGRKCVVKVYKHRIQDGDMQHEASMMKAVRAKVCQSCLCFFPEVLAVEERKLPFPHLVLSFGGPCVKSVLSEVRHCPPKVILIIKTFTESNCVGGAVAQRKLIRSLSSKPLTRV